MRYYTHILICKNTKNLAWKNLSFLFFFFRITQCRARLVTAHCWDMEDPRLLVCRAQKLESHDSKSFHKNDDKVIFI